VEGGRAREIVQQSVDEADGFAESFVEESDQASPERCYGAGTAYRRNSFRRVGERLAVAEDV